MNLRPTHRNPEAMAGLEVCDLCGLMVEQHRLIEADVEGLRGLVVCDAHPWERRARDAPSLNDIRAMTPPPYAPDAGHRLEPIGGDVLAFEDYARYVDVSTPRAWSATAGDIRVTQ